MSCPGSATQSEGRFDFFGAQYAENFISRVHC